MSLKCKNTAKHLGQIIAQPNSFNSSTTETDIFCLNDDILDRDIYPESFKLANIVSIYKKGDATQMKNYRPIALLQTLYKILAGLIKNRLLQAYDPWIQRSQFGFRPKKSTAQAIFLARRPDGHLRTYRVKSIFGSIGLENGF